MTATTERLTGICPDCGRILKLDALTRRNLPFHYTEPRPAHNIICKGSYKEANKRGKSQ
jgi:hypothetical protein